MTQMEQVLSELAGVRAGLTNREIERRTGIKGKSVRTVIWEAKRRGLLDTVGGERGNYRYGLTEAGLEELPPEARPRVPVEEKVVRDASFDEITKVIDRIADFKLIRNFVSWMLYDKAVDFGDPNEDYKRLLPSLAVEYIGADPEQLAQERDALQALMQLVAE